MEHMNNFKASAVRLIFLSCLVLAASSTLLNAQEMDKKNDKLAVLWVSGDREVAESSCLMYTHAAKRNGWFDEVVLILWGPSSKLVAEDKALQEKLKVMQKDGVILEACITCANMLGVTEELKTLDINVIGMGVPLTNYLKQGYHVLTY